MPENKTNTHTAAARPARIAQEKAKPIETTGTIGRIMGIIGIVGIGRAASNTPAIGEQA